MKWINKSGLSASGRPLYFYLLGRVAIAVAVSRFFLTTIQASAEPVPGSLDVHWSEGASDCTANPQRPFKPTFTSRKRLSCAKVRALTSKPTFSIFLSGRTKLS